MLAKCGKMYLSVPMQRELSWNFHRNNVYGHFEQVCKTKFYKLVHSAIRYFCGNSMIAHAALVLKTRFAIIQSILDSVEYLENYEIILATFSSSCFYMLSLS